MKKYSVLIWIDFRKNRGAIFILKILLLIFVIDIAIVIDLLHLQKI